MLPFLFRAGLPLAAVLLWAAPQVRAADRPVPATPRASYYDYDARSPFSSTQEPLGMRDGAAVFRVTFPSPVTTPFAVNNTVTAYLFLPPGPGPHPAMLVEHEWLPRNLDNEFHMSEVLCRAGIAALLLVEPFSLNRRPALRSPDAELLSGNVPQMLNGLRQAVLDSRRALDWLSARPDIDPLRLGVAGISLGGILASLIAGVDRRAGVLLSLVGGADVADIVWDSPFLSGLRPELERRGYSYRSLKQAMAPVEPALWLDGFRPENALLINGRYDIFVEPKQAERLARALGGARIVWANTGHYGIVFSERQVEQVGTAFLRSRFFSGTAAYQPPDTLPSRTIKLGILAGGQEGLSPALAVQAIDFDRAGRYSLDGQLTLHGLSAALSGRLDLDRTVGLELPLGHGHLRPRPFLLFHFVL